MTIFFCYSVLFSVCASFCQKPYYYREAKAYYCRKYMENEYSLEKHLENSNETLYIYIQYITKTFFNMKSAMLFEFILIPYRRQKR